MPFRQLGGAHTSCSRVTIMQGCWGPAVVRQLLVCAAGMLCMGDGLSEACQAYGLTGLHLASDSLAYRQQIGQDILSLPAHLCRVLASAISSVDNWNGCCRRSLLG